MGGFELEELIKNSCVAATLQVMEWTEAAGNDGVRSYYRATGTRTGLR